MKYARKIGLGDSFTTGTLYKPDLSGTTLIKNDLEWVAHHWQDTTFDREYAISSPDAIY
jgi:glucoamylase